VAHAFGDNDVDNGYNTGTQEGGHMPASHTAQSQRIEDLANELNIEVSVLFSEEKHAVVLPALGRKSDLVYAPFSKEIAKALSSEGVCTCLYEDEREKHDLIRKSADIILPVILFLGNVAVTVGVTVIANWIYDRFLRGRKSTEPAIRIEIAEVDTETGIVSRHTIEGLASEVRGLLEKGLERSPGNAVSEGSCSCADAEIGNTSHTLDHSKASVSYQSAQESYKRGQTLLARGEENQAEEAFREALRLLQIAYLLDDRPPILMAEMHEVGREVQTIFSCPLEMRDGQYWNSCPAFLSHYAGGFSIGGIGTAVCSICGRSMLECDHVPGEVYKNVIARRTPGGLCTICAKEQCNHEDGATYDDVTAFGIMTDIDLDHIAYVSRPEDPLCTVTAVPISRAEIARQLPPEELAQFKFGKTRLFCTHCRVCDGQAKKEAVEFR